MERNQRFSTDRLLQMLGAALTRQDEKMVQSKVAESKVDCGISEQRQRIVSWLIDLNTRFEFDAETLFLSVAIFDQFLASVKAHPKYLNCIGVSCLYLAAKTVEEDRSVPDTLTLVRSSECGCSVAEVLRMERCILDKLGWDLRLATSWEFLHIFHALLMSRCPHVLDATGLAPSQHVARLTRRLQTCLLDPQLAGFTPSTLALATLSLDLELFVGWQLWLPATITLQTLAQIGGRDLVWCRELAVRCVPGAGAVRAAAALVASSRTALASVVLPKPAAKRKVDEMMAPQQHDDDLYDGIKRLYAAEELAAATSTSSDIKTTCAGEMMRLPAGGATRCQKHDFITRVNN